MEYVPSLKYGDTISGSKNPSVLFITPTNGVPTRAVNHSIRFSYAEFWGVKDVEGAAINTSDVLFGYKTGSNEQEEPLYLLKRTIPPGEGVPMMVDNVLIKRDLSEFVFKTQSPSDGILILYWQ